jgi:hypothetical protein
VSGEAVGQAVAVEADVGDNEDANHVLQTAYLETSGCKCVRPPQSSGV